MSDVCVVIPAHNEEKTIETISRRVRSSGYSVIVVDDGSCDATAKKALSGGAEVISLPLNVGKGFAAKVGMDTARKRGFDALVLMDGDGQHDVEDITRIIEPIMNGSADIVVGCRGQDERMPFIFRLGNRFLASVTRLLYQIDISDSQSGFRAMTLKAYDAVRWDSKKYDMESEMLVKAGKKHLKYKEIPIKTIYDNKYKGTTIVDGLRIFVRLLWWRVW